MSKDLQMLIGFAPFIFCSLLILVGDFGEEYLGIPDPNQSLQYFSFYGYIFWLPTLIAGLISYKNIRKKSE